jgi:general secretion pathway protein D
MRWLKTLSLLLCVHGGTLAAQTIAEKKAGITVMSKDLTPELSQLLIQVNTEISAAQQRLQKLYLQVNKLYHMGAPEDDYSPLLDLINETKARITGLENSWREAAAMPDRGSGYSLWYQPETTIGQLINDYGSYSYIYVAAPEIASMRVSIDSNLPIPRSSWNDVLELILQQSGIGIRQVNSYIRELYILNGGRPNVKMITNQRHELDFLPSNSQVAFMLEPELSEVRRIWLFLERFVNPQTTTLQVIGRDILVIGSVSEIKDLLKIYDFAATHRGEKEYKTVAVRKIDVEEMANILGALFDAGNEQVSRGISSRPSGEVPIGQGPIGQAPSLGGKRGRAAAAAAALSSEGSNVSGGGLRIIPLRDVAQALFLVGTREEIRKAEEIIQQVESQIGDVRERAIYWYTVKHSDPEELAQVLSKIYNLMIATGAGSEVAAQEIAYDLNNPPQQIIPPPPAPYSPYPEQAGFQPAAQKGVYEEGYFLTDRFVVNPDSPTAQRPPPNSGRENFIVDIKSGALVMVVETDLLPKMKELIKKLDVPKKMVQIEVMLFETVINRQNQMGLNLLQIGSLASNINATSLTYGAAIDVASQAASFPVAPLLFDLIPRNGITDFLLSRSRHGGTPAYDAFYRFLISRDDIRINATPSLLTVNQTEATIEIEEEISVNTGIFVIQDAGTPTLKDSFARARYGIKITVTPTVHVSGKDSLLGDEPNYVTLDSEIKFESIVNNIENRPDVVRRTIKNEARIADGQTVIIGGLRRKDSQDSKTAIPYLGEIPGIGKLFSQNVQHDRSTEMFIFMTPRIITEPSEQLECIKMEEVNRRPGDIPSFLTALMQAEEEERNRLFDGTVTMLFGRTPDRFVDDEGCVHDRE